MQKQQLKIDEKLINELSSEARRMLEILDQIESHTTELRKKLIEELKPSDNTVHLRLDSIDQAIQSLLLEPKNTNANKGLVEILI